MHRLKDKVALVIGAGQSPGESIGNGRATALRFAQEGARVMAADRDEASAQQTIAMIDAHGQDHATVRCDVSQTADIALAVETTLRRWGRIDILFYNVGVSLMGGDQPLDGLQDEAFDRVMRINLRGAIMAAKEVLPVMKAQGEGVVLNVASITAVETFTPLVTYRASKAGMIAFTQQFAIHNAEYGIRANVILPGLMETAMAVDTRARHSGRPREDIIAERNSRVPLRRKGGTGWDVANAALFLASDEASFITGAALPVDGGTLARIGW